MAETQVEATSKRGEKSLYYAVLSSGGVLQAKTKREIIGLIEKSGPENISFVLKGKPVNIAAKTTYYIVK